jgi:shikimate kinase
MKIFLIGMPGSGKTTLGRQLADELMLPFVDLDQEIEVREGISVQEVFAQRGEDHFRQVESETLREWAGSEKEFVMATGGGAPCFYQGIDAINQSGLSIFLDEPVAELLRRLAKKTDRPLLETRDQKEKEERLQTLRENRLQYYTQAKISVTSPDLQKVLKAIRLTR